MVKTVRPPRPMEWAVRRSPRRSRGRRRRGGTSAQVEERQARRRARPSFAVQRHPRQHAPSDVVHTGQLDTRPRRSRRNSRGYSCAAHCIRDGGDDAFPAVLLGQDVPRVGLDLQVRRHRCLGHEGEQLAQVVLRVAEEPEPLAEERHVKMDAPLTRLAGPGLRDLQRFRQIEKPGEPAAGPLHRLMQIDALRERPQRASSGAVWPSKTPSARRSPGSADADARG